MGFDVNGSRFLIYAKTLGVSFEKTATLGRQEMQINATQLRRNLADFGFHTTAEEAERLSKESQGYAESFLKRLGAREVASMDASDFEQATCVHDFNVPIPDELKNRFTAVVDGGTLEHIFNLPVAIKNCMEMVRVGGHFIGISPTNNWPGHGFYQLSPELFFRVFCRQNGYKIVKIIVYEDKPLAKWYEVIDPDLVKHRVTFVNSTQTYLGIIAQRIEAVEPFRSCPQQSDYVAQWTSTENAAEPSAAQPLSLYRKARRLLAPARNYFYWKVYWKALRFYRKFSPFDPRFFKPLADPPIDRNPS
ncbi:MAG: hypothetical protein ACJ8FY_04385 [Gemmataceae bacterium]